ncbi:MAG TPA: type II secretion system F family protein [Methylophilaceae bacterium]|jgi:general secretion pathway protein F
MQYQLRVIKASGTPSQIAIDAASELEARQRAEQQGYTVLRVANHARKIRLGAERFPLVLFCQELRVLLEAGLPLPDSLDTLIEKETRTETRAILAKLLSAVREGQQLSDAMANLPGAFPSLFVATVKAAETTGNLPEALTRYALYIEQIDILKKRIISASIYPALVLTFGFLVLVFLMAYVVPRFSKIYESHVSNLSFTTKLLLQLGKFSQDYGLIVLVLLFGLGALLTSLFSQPAIREKLFDAFWKLPYLGEKVRIYHLSRLYRTFSMLLRSGIPVVTGLGMVNSLLGVSLQSNLSKAKRLISEGLSFSEAFESCGLTTPVAGRLFRVGERTGKLETMMERSAIFHEEQMLRWVDAFTKVFEPLLMAVIGVIIGGIVLMMYLPIFELASGLQ